ncbi:MAG: NAD(P)-dependent oxidoreductase [Chloroflexi bacterium]|nr:NAD(P)-dependent oxidoreductase [Chloroflexota bacterium]MDA1226527.1 NAD(P)-dependent oxidoreductase [Chloroflexota bacterium]
MAEKQKVVITGFGGRIARVLRENLGDKYEFSGIDRVPVEGLNSLTADLTNFDAILPVFQGKDVVVHLAAEPRHTTDIGWDILLPDNVVATANVFEAARRGGVKRIIFFSSMHVDGKYELDYPYSAIAEGNYEGLEPEKIPLVAHDMPDRPDGPYAVSKIFGEALARYYAEEYEMTSICIRLGTVSPANRPGSDPRSFVSWFSHRDLVTMVDRSIEVKNVTFDIFFGASGNTWKIYDTPRAWRVLGAEPQDDSESFRE